MLNRHEQIDEVFSTKPEDYLFRVDVTGGGVRGDPKIAVFRKAGEMNSVREARGVWGVNETAA